MSRNNKESDYSENTATEKDRYVPGDPTSEYLEQEHYVRYIFASKFVKDKRVLDVACGSGYGCDILLKGGASEVIGVDISNEAISYCKNNYHDKNLKFEQGNALSLNFKNKSFDIITAFEFIEHIKEGEEFIRECKCVLKDDGILILSTPNKEVYGTDHPLNVKEINPFHVKEYSKKEFEDLLKKFFDNVSFSYQIYPNTMAIISQNPDEKIKELPFFGGITKDAVEEAKYFIAICSKTKVKADLGFVYLFDKKTLFKANYEEYKRWIKSLTDQNRDLIEQYDRFVNLLMNEKTKSIDKKKRLSNALRELNIGKERIKPLAIENEALAQQVERLRKALAVREKMILDIHQSFVFRMLRKYDSTIGKVIPLRLKKYTKSNKIELTQNELLSYINEASSNISLDKKDLLCFSIIPWDYRYQRPQHILTRFARRGHRIFYLTTNLRTLQRPYEIKTIDSHIYEITLSSKRFFDIYKDKFDESLLNSLTESIKLLQKDLKIDAFVYVMFPTWAPLVMQLRKTFGYRIIFDCLDDFTEFSNVSKARTKEEEDLMKNSDLVICSSNHLYKKTSQFTQKTILLPNAGEFDHFKSSLDNILRDYKKPIIGYFGSIAEWFDTDIIEFAAKERPNYNYIFLGSTYGSDIRHLSKLSNVHFLGERPYLELPKYLHGFDVCIIPFKITPLIESTHPVKVYEYLASGKPVVATRIPELLKMADICYIAENKEDFVTKLDMAVKEKDDSLVKKRIDFAAKNTWNHRFEDLYSELKKIPQCLTRENKSIN